MLAKIIIIALLVSIVIALFTAVYFLVKDPSNRRRTLRSLTWRVSLQVVLILFLVAAVRLGWIQPHAALPSDTVNANRP
jgi:hypothetical protein